MNNSKLIVPLVVGIALALGLFLGKTLSPKKENLDPKAQKLNDILGILENKYVDSVDKENLFEGAIADMLHDLDPHSNYIPAKNLQAVNESIEGRFGGVGVRFAIIRDTLCITNVIANSPSERAGILSRDQFVEIDGQNITGDNISNKRVMELLKGLEGTDVEIKVFRNNDLIDKTITRGSIPINSITSSFMLDDKTGYIQLNSFSLTSAQEFYFKAQELKAAGMENLIFDLRFNGGGVLDGAVKICDMLLEKNLPIVSTKGKNQVEMTDYSINHPLLANIKLAVLINGSSASASEIVAGAIQDNDRGTIIGRRSFGKGLVQQDMMLKDSSNLRLTIARYYTPTGRSIQKSYKNGFEEYMHDEQDRYENGELYAPDSTLMVDSLKFVTPGGKVVYGGGGIMPDIFVPLDTTGSSYYYTKLQYANVVNDFAFDYAKTHPNLNTTYNSFKNYKNSFSVSDNLLTQLTDYALRDYKIKLNKKEFNHSKERLRINLKANIARQFWLEDGSQFVFSQEDEEIQRALKLFAE